MTTESEEALRLAQLIKRLRQYAMPDPHDEREVMHAPLLREAADAIFALSTRSCSECAEFKRLQAELAQSEKSGESVAEDASDCIVALQAMTERAEAAERKLGEKG